MQIKSILAVLASVLILSNVVAAQDLYNSSLGARGYANLSVNDRGSAFSGGASFSPFNDGPSSTTLFRGGVKSGGLCNFDLLAGFVEKFETLPEEILALAGPLAFGFALQILCETAPSYCDIIKQIYQAANFSLRAQFGRCQDLVLTGMSLASASQREALKKCVQGKQAAGIGIENAMQTCPAEINAPSGINGIEAPNFGIVQTVLESTTAPPEFIAQITAMVGEITLAADGTIFSQDGTKKKDSIFTTYAEVVEEAVEAVQETVEALSDGGLPDQSVLDKLGGPGYPASADTLIEIAHEQDTEFKNYEIQRFATNIAYSRMISNIHELADTLQDSTESSALTPEIRAALEAKHKSLRRQVARIKDMREAAMYQERHVQEVMRRKSLRAQEVAAVANTGLGGPIISRYPEGQTPMGYVR